MNTTMLVAALAALTPVAPEPARDLQPIEVVLDISEGGQPAISFTLTLVGDHGCAELAEQEGPTKNEVQVCREGGDATTPILAIQLERDQKVGDQSRVRKLRLKSRPRAGKPVLISRTATGQGGPLEITATVRTL